MTLRQQTDAILVGCSELSDKIQQQPTSKENDNVATLANSVMLLAKIASDLDENVKRLALWEHREEHLPHP